MKKIDITQYKKIVILTGAGISAASGIAPFRGAGAQSDDLDVTKHSSAELLFTNPEAIWRFYGPMRNRVSIAKPNPAHFALASIERTVSPDASFTLITQNVDKLHENAGSKNVVKLHGDLFESVCTNPDCDLEPIEDFDLNNPTKVPHCPKCGSALRPGVVLFGEQLPIDAQRRAKHALRDCDLFIAIGTSGTVAPASNYVRSADYEGARTIYVNLTEMNPVNRYFKESVIGKAEEILPELFGIKHEDMDDYPLATKEWEQTAKELFPGYKTMDPEEWAARYAHGVGCSSFDQYHYEDEVLHKWIHRLHQILGRDVSEYRKKYLTEEEISAIEKEEEDIAKYGL